MADPKMVKMVMHQAAARLSGQYCESQGQGAPHVIVSVEGVSFGVCYKSSDCFTLVWPWLSEEGVQSRREFPDLGRVRTFLRQEASEMARRCCLAAEGRTRNA